MKYIKLMMCGHVANGINKEGKHVCNICNCTSEMTVPSARLKNRKARCVICGNIVKSNISLRYFSYRPFDTLDEYYCGCKEVIE